jgi:hypothetical protein
LQRIQKEEAALATALAEMRKGRDAPDVPSMVPPLDDDAIRGAMDHLERAVIQRVIQQRGGMETGDKVGAWLHEFREACLRTDPKLINPAVTVRALERRLERLRAEGGLPKLSELKVRKSQRAIGMARLRSWGLVERRR